MIERDERRTDRPARVLYVEDSADLRLAVRLTLEASGWEVVEAESGAQALEILGGSDPDVVLLDLGLPDIPGAEVLDRIKAEPATAWLPVLVLSGRSDSEDVTSMLRAGAQDYLIKPFDADELEARLRAARRVAVEHRDVLASEAQYRTAFEAAPVGMAELDLDGRYIAVNAALCEMLRCEPFDLAGHPLTDRVHPDDLAVSVQALRAIAGGQPFAQPSEQRLLSSNGHVLWTSLSCVAITDREGAIDHLLVHFFDVTDRKGLEDELQHMANHDPLTGLLNRRGFELILDRHAAFIGRHGASGALLLVDLDDFKAINDAHGHSVGDELLVSVADLLRRILRGADVVSRLGGDEFGVLLPTADARAAAVVAEKIVQGMRTISNRRGDRQEHATASVGGALFDDPRCGAPEVLVSADTAMYEAKGAGRDGWVIRTGEPSDHDLRSGTDGALDGG